MSKTIDKIKNLASLRGCSAAAMLAVATKVGDGKPAEAKIVDKTINPIDLPISTPQTPIIGNIPEIPADTIAPFRVIEDVPQMSKEQEPSKMPKSVESQKPLDKDIDFDFDKDNSDYIKACEEFTLAYDDKNNPNTSYDKEELGGMAMAMNLQKNIDKMSPITDGLNKVANGLEKVVDGKLSEDAINKIAKETKTASNKAIEASGGIINDFKEDLKMFSDISNDKSGKAMDKFLDKSYSEAKKALSANDKEEQKMESKTANNTPLSYAASKRMQKTY